MGELLKCRCCGHDEAELRTDSFAMHQVRCKNCGRASRWFNDASEAEYDWNEKNGSITDCVLSEKEKQKSKTRKTDAKKADDILQGYDSKFISRWNEEQVQSMLGEYFTSYGRSAPLFTNISFGFFKQKNIEADCLRMTEEGYLHEYEIKRSFTDFKNDFKKKNFHDDVRIARLTYVLPERMACSWLREFVKSEFNNFKRGFSFLFYSEEMGHIITQRNAGYVDWAERFDSNNYITAKQCNELERRNPAFPYIRRLFGEERSELYRLMMYRYWSLNLRVFHSVQRKMCGDGEEKKVSDGPSDAEKAAILFDK